MFSAIYVVQTRPAHPLSSRKYSRNFVLFQGISFGWTTSVSSILDMSRLLATAQITDSYLLALAIAHDGQLATFDRRLIPDAVHDGVRGLHRIASAFPPA
jgi:predicted nucleic acid-binding protein